MTLKVFKYNLPVQEKSSLLMPEHSQVLSVQVQHEQLTLWALVNPDNEECERKFLIFGTGHEIEEPGQDEYYDYIGTVQAMGGQLVWHIFEVI